MKYTLDGNGLRYNFLIFHARREALIIDSAYQTYSNQGKWANHTNQGGGPFGKLLTKNRTKLIQKIVWPHGPSAILDRFTGTLAHLCTLEAWPLTRAIPPPSWSCAPPATTHSTSKNSDASATVPLNCREISVA